MIEQQDRQTLDNILKTLHLVLIEYNKENCHLKLIDQNHQDDKGYIINQLQANNSIYMHFHGLRSYMSTFYRVFYSRKILNIACHGAQDIYELIDDSIWSLCNIAQNHDNDQINLYLTGHSYGGIQAIIQGFIMKLTKI